MKLFSTLIGLILFSTITFSQTAIYGKVTDEASGEELIYANVVLNKNGAFVAGGSTDFDGNYNLPVAPGTYDVVVSYTGYTDIKKEGIIISTGQGTKIDIKTKAGIPHGNIIVTTCGPPLIQPENVTSSGTLSNEEIAKLPSTNCGGLSATSIKKIPIISDALVTIKYTPTVSVQGSILDETTQEPLIGAHIIFTKEGKYIDATTSDFAGNYIIKLPVDVYDIEYTYLGYQSQTKKAADLKRKKNRNLEVQLVQGITMEEIVIIAYSCSLSEFIGCRTTVGFQRHDCFNNNNPLSSEALEQSPTNKQYTLYPNPASNYFNISSTKNINAIQVFSSNGKLIYQQNEIQENKIEIQIDNWPAGTYFVNCQADGESITEQLVVINR